LYVHAKLSLNSFNICSTYSNLFPVVHYFSPFVVLHQFPNWVSLIIDFQLTSIQLSTIHVFWCLLEFHSLQHSMVDVCNMSPNTPYLPELFMVHIYCNVSSFLCFVFQIHVMKY
jgi:hypothetical protein